MSKAILNELAKMRDAAAIKTGNAGNGKQAITTHLYRQSETDKDLFRSEFDAASPWITENEMLAATSQTGKISTPRIVIINSYIHQDQSVQLNDIQ